MNRGFQVIAASTLYGIALVSQAQQSVTTDAGTINAEQTKRFFKEDIYSPYAGRNFPDRPLWGDQHLHTSWSPDAVGGGTRLGPEEAYRFARGEEVTSSTGQKVRLARPLDWMAVSDHSDAMGVVADIIAGKPELMTDPVLKKWNQMTNAGPDEAMKAVMEMITLQGQGKLPKAMTDPNTFRDVWHRYTTIAEEYNEPGRFTAMIGYEWTSNYGGGNNLHRNIMYRDGSGRRSSAGRRMNDFIWPCVTTIASRFCSPNHGPVRPSPQQFAEHVRPSFLAHHDSVRPVR